MKNTATPYWRYRIQAIARTQNLRALKDGSETTVSADEFISICQSQKWKCAYCDKKLVDFSATMDHKTAQSRGGKHVASNIQALCFSCNAAKQSRSDDEHAAAILAPRLRRVRNTP